jgi:Uma2 family endonuclease
MNDYGHKAYRTMDWERRYTLDEYMNLPDPLERLELHDGRLYLRPLEYMYVVMLRTRICELLTATVGEANAACAPSLAFQPPGDNLWVAGIGLVSRERWKEAGTEHDYLRLAPELVVEIVWEERPIDEINKLRPVALSSGCEAFWIVDPAQKSVLDVRAEATVQCSMSDELRLPQPWSEYRISVARVFEPPEC